jgi:hypothetical protein
MGPAKVTQVLRAMQRQKKPLYIITILFIAVIASGQNDTLDRKEVNKKKSGYWKVFLDEKGFIVKSGEDAYFYGYQYYIKGKKVGPEFKKHRQYKIASFVGSVSVRGNPQLIHGKIISYDKTGRKILEEEYGYGTLQHMRSFLYKDRTDKTPILFEDINYREKYNGIPLTYFIQQHALNGTVQSWWYRDGKKGWTVYPVE